MRGRWPSVHGCYRADLAAHILRAAQLQHPNSQDHRLYAPALHHSVKFAMPFPPHHTTLSHVTKETWQELAAKKRQSLYDAIPKDWLLPKGKYDDLINVMEVPKECGLLSAQELEITEIDDLSEVRLTCFQGQGATVHQLISGHICPAGPKGGTQRVLSCQRDYGILQESCDSPPVDQL